jgi:hypothetical protein
MPFLGIVDNVLSDVMQSKAVSNDALVIIALPEALVKWFPTLVMNSCDVGMGSDGFKCPNHIP